MSEEDFACRTLETWLRQRPEDVTMRETTRLLLLVLVYGVLCALAAAALVALRGT